MLVCPTSLNAETLVLSPLRQICSIGMVLDIGMVTLDHTFMFVEVLDSALHFLGRGLALGAPMFIRPRHWDDPNPHCGPTAGPPMKDGHCDVQRGEWGSRHSTAGGSGTLCRRQPKSQPWRCMFGWRCTSPGRAHGKNQTNTSPNRIFLDVIWQKQNTYTHTKAWLNDPRGVQLNASPRTGTKPKLGSNQEP